MTVLFVKLKFLLKGVFVLISICGLTIGVSEIADASYVKAAGGMVIAVASFFGVRMIKQYDETLKKVIVHDSQIALMNATINNNRDQAEIEYKNVISNLGDIKNTLNVLIAKKTP